MEARIISMQRKPDYLSSFTINGVHMYQQCHLLHVCVLLCRVVLSRVVLSRKFLGKLSTWCNGCISNGELGWPTLYWN